MWRVLVRMHRTAEVLTRCVCSASSAGQGRIVSDSHPWSLPCTIPLTFYVQSSCISWICSWWHLQGGRYITYIQWFYGELHKNYYSWQFESEIKIFADTLRKPNMARQLYMCKKQIWRQLEWLCYVRSRWTSRPVCASCARHLLRLPGHENYICDCEEALHSLQKALSMDGWFFHCQYRTCNTSTEGERQSYLARFYKTSQNLMTCSGRRVNQSMQMEANKVHTCVSKLTQTGHDQCMASAGWVIHCHRTICCSMQIYLSMNWGPNTSW
jgi:hypothetical protein